MAAITSGPHTKHGIVFFFFEFLSNKEDAYKTLPQPRKA